MTFDYATGNSVRVDYMVFKPLNNSVSGIEKGDFYCYEIKSCKKDFESGHGLNFIGDYNYLVLPQGLYEEIKTSIPYNVGVYEPSKDNWAPLKCIKKAQRSTRTKSVSECLLMMFRSSNRELLKTRKTYKIHEIETNFIYDDEYATVEEAQKVIDEYIVDDGDDRTVTYEVIVE